MLEFEGEIKIRDMLHVIILQSYDKNITFLLS